MKTGKYITVLSVALLAAAGCSDDKTETVYKPYSTVVEVAADCELPVKFGEGDELYINRKPFTLYANNLINLHDAAPALEYLLYAPAPNSEEDTRLVYTLPAKQTYVKNGIDLKSCPVFGFTDNHAMNDKIEVHPACGALKLSIPAPEDKGFAAVTSIKLRTYDYVLAGDISLDCTTGAVDWLGAASQALTLSGSIDISAPEPEKAAKSAEGAEGGETPTPEEPAVHYTDVYFALPPMKIHDNLEVTMISSKGSAIFTIDTKNKVIEQGKVASVIAPVDKIEWTAAKPFYGKTNCVLVAPGTTSVTVDCAPYMTTSLTYAYEFIEGSEEAASAGVLWNDVSPTFITNVQLAANHKSFTATLDGQPGNAVVAIYDNSGTVLWSFHIWVTEHADHDYGTNDLGNHYIVMDRNLGATSSTPYDGRANGLLYEWGRKDPFVGGDATLGAKETRPIYNESGTCTFDSPAAGSTSRDLQWSIAHPMTYLMRAQSKNTTTPPYRFNNDWLVYGDNALWGNPEGYDNPKASTLRKSIYDPCPEGYMVAPNDVWIKNTAQSIFPGTGWMADEANKGLSFEYNGNSIWYPAAGLYNRTSGKIQDVGVDGSTQKSCPLSKAPDGKNYQNSAYIIIKNNNPTAIGNGNCRGNAYSVRCVKETAE